MLPCCIAAETERTGRRQAGVIGATLLPALLFGLPAILLCQ